MTIAGSYASPIMDDMDKIFRESNSKTVVVVFSADWLGAAVVLDSFMEDFSKQFPKIRFYRIDIDKADGAAEKFGISTVPTTLILRKKEIINHFTGVPPKQKILQILKSL